jgi:hypothetical protein
MIWAFIPAWLRRAAAWAVAALVAIGGAWAVGRRDGAVAAKTKAAEKEAAKYRATTERMQDADTGNADGSDDAEWLSNRGKR